MSIENPDFKWMNQVNVDKFLLDEYIQHLYERRSVVGDFRVAWLLRAITCIDLTTLAGDDTDSNVRKLCYKAQNPLEKSTLNNLELDQKELLKCAAVCVYPAKVKTACDGLKEFKSDLPVASVATGFPSGQYSLKSRLMEIEFAVENGASEIDVVISRELALTGEWFALHSELVQMKKACNTAHMKVILAIGELGTYENVYKASYVAMIAGADFIKTSTGKEAVNATLPAGAVMCRAIRDFYWKTGIRVGFKPAGGIKTSADAINWLILIKEQLGDDWLNNKLFRIGASSLLNDIQRELYIYVHGHLPNS